MWLRMNVFTVDRIEGDQQTTNMLKTLNTVKLGQFIIFKENEDV